MQNVMEAITLLVSVNNLRTVVRYLWHVFQTCKISCLFQEISSLLPLLTPSHPSLAPFRHLVQSRNFCRNVQILHSEFHAQHEFSQSWLYYERTTYFSNFRQITFNALWFKCQLKLLYVPPQRYVRVWWGTFRLPTSLNHY